MLEPPTAENARGELTVEFAAGETILTVVAPIVLGGAVIETVALADFVVSAELKALIVTLPPDGTELGAV